jgi:hypothetical protein
MHTLFSIDLVSGGAGQMDWMEQERQKKATAFNCKQQPIFIFPMGTYQ